jgi:hypothetical protein
MNTIHVTTKRVTFAILAVALALTGVNPAVAAPQSQLTGSGIVLYRLDGGADPVYSRFAVSAHGMPGDNDLDAEGSVNLDIEGHGSSKGSVDCLDVRGNIAAVAGTLNNPIDGFGYYFARVVDNGPGNSGVPDNVAVTLTEEPSACNPRRVPSEIHSGNFTVKDRSTNG